MLQSKTIIKILAVVLIILTPLLWGLFVGRVFKLLEMRRARRSKKDV